MWERKEKTCSNIPDIICVFVSVSVYAYVIMYAHVCMSVYVGIRANVYMYACVLCD